MEFNKLNKIAKEISMLENMPIEAKEYYESCILVAQYLYDLDFINAQIVADIIQKKYIEIKN